MTRKEAIEIINRENDPNDKDTWKIFPEYREALDMAIKALEQESSGDMVHVETLHQVMWERDIAIEQLKELGYSLGQKIDPCDAISRKDAIESAKGIYNSNSETKALCIITMLKELPSVTPSRPKGTWIIDERPESDRETICTNCEQPIFKYHKLDFDYRPHFCPNCGAEME